jgi:dihydrofolate synthase/folylpolyglutamate synthase
VDAYRAALDYLTRLEVTAGWDLKLERMRAAVARFGHPERAWPSVHIAGTNGKGSTAAMVEAILRAAGYRTGLYTSPHLVDFTERMRVDGRTIPREAVVALVDEMRGGLERAGIALTHFEFVTLMAFEWFRRVGIEVGVIEVGLGGRLDATNVLEPAATAITHIALDHEEYLGHTIPEVAAEKAGILKPGVPAVIGRLAPEAEAVVLARAAALEAPVLQVGRHGALTAAASGWGFRSAGISWSALRLAMPGSFQCANAEVALLTIAALRDRLPCEEEAVRRGLESAAWPGRLAVVRREPLVLLDGAHNPAGAAALERELPAVLGGRAATLVFAVMRDKEWHGILERLLPHVRRVVVTRVGPRGADPAAIAAAIAGRVPVRAVDGAGRAIAETVAGTPPDEAVLVTGSLYLVGEAYSTLAAPGENLFQPWYAPGSGATEPAPCGPGARSGTQGRAPGSPGDHVARSPRG